MTLDSALPLLYQSAAYSGLLKLLGRSRAAAEAVLPSAALPYCVATLRRSLNVPIVVVVARPEQARRLYEDLLVWCGEGAGLHHFPEGETLPFERLMADEATTHARLRALLALSPTAPAPSPGPIIVTSLAAAAQRTVDADTFRGACQTVAVGQKIPLGALMEGWQRLGYRVDRTVEVPGTISRRGGILDIFPPGAPSPFRIELMGDTIESIRQFDPGSQRSLGPAETVTVIPAQESLPAVVGRKRVEELYGRMDLSNCTPADRDRIQEEMGLLLEGHTLEEQGFYHGFFCGGTLLDYLPAHGLLVVERPAEVEEEGRGLNEKAQSLREAKESRGEVPRGFPSLHVPWEELEGRLSATPLRLEAVPWARSREDQPATPSFDLAFATPQGYMGRLDSLAQDARRWLQAGDRVLLVSHHAARLAQVLQGQGVPTEHLNGAGVQEAVALPEGAVGLLRGSLSEGFEMDMGRGATLHLLTDVEVMGQSKTRPLRRRAPVQREAFLSDLEPGAYLVHLEHGIGRFAGTRRMGADEAEREYLVLEYAEGDRLFVPTDQLDRVSHYTASGDRPPSLTRLSTQEWARAKDKARASTKQLAIELLSLYAAREVLEGFAFSADTPWQMEMEDSFPYEETRDQLETIHQVKLDMEQSKPMDRLVCGDVGYGKTEVALRAAFKAVMDGMQVAVLAPTTVLAQQHYVTFTQRMAPFPVTVEVLSRFRTPEEQRSVTERLAQGKVDICIGTHRLLQKDVVFKDLGLVIVDEEQRFGVGHKERLKEMRREADIMTLSATPIPRTLHMAFSGIRDMSTIETPPEERLSIKTYVSEYSDQVVREAILREVDRGGQVFFLHNRVRSIESVSERLRDLVPEASITIGHGQMSEEALSGVMEGFARGDHDVLVCTTIIEAGLDLPNVNTLIIDRADMLGLSQLYQLRGRVGRGANRAYAYLMVPARGRITETAEKRLKTIMAATELGAGFRIAMRDLEIRGAGNILGPEQSGHIHAIGYDLYSQMLGQAVEELRAQQDGGVHPAARTVDVKVDLPLSAYIPLNYVADLTTRLGVYQRLARPQPVEAIDSLAEELRDRFGPVPAPVRELLYVVELKARAREAGVESISRDRRVAVLQLTEPVGGAAAVLQKTLGGAAQVGHSQIRVPLRGEWRKTLLEVLTGFAAFKERLLGLAGGG